MVLLPLITQNHYLSLLPPVYKNSLDAINYLTDLHRYTYRHLGEEIIWNASMPCYLEGPDDIRIRRIRQLQQR